MATSKDSPTTPFQDISNYDEKLLASHRNVHLFTVFDYGLFGLMLALSAAIGIYFGWFAKRKQNNTTEYLLGGKKMKFFPIAASLIASHINGFTMLAVPAEVYAHGSEYSLCVISAILVRVFFFFSR
jgi:solute carrier family 5 (sodium-coupled monocarboxylate transporter), member 8/12